MVLEEIIEKLDSELPAEEKLKRKSSSNSSSVTTWLLGSDKPWMGYGVSFIVFGLLLFVTFRYVMGFGF